MAPPRRSSASGSPALRSRFLSLRNLLPLALVALCAFVSSTSALTELAAVQFESYIPRLGTPRFSSSPSLSLSPRYHRIVTHAEGIVEAGKAQTALFSVSESNVVGASNPRNGAIVWRQNLDDEIQGFWLDADTAVVVSGQGGEKVQVFQALGGWLIWSKQLLQPGTGRLSNNDSFAQSPSQREAFPAADVVFVPSTGDARWNPVVLNNGDTVRRLEVESGKEIWRFSRRDNGEDSASSPSVRILATTSSYIHLLSLVPSTPTAFGLQHQVLSAQTGALLYTAPLHGVAIDRTRGAADLIPFGLNPATSNASSSTTAPPQPHVVWLHTDGTMRSLPLALPPLDDSAASFKPKLPSPKVVYAKENKEKFNALRAVGLGDRGYAIGVRDSGKAEVLYLKPDGKDRNLVGLWEFEDDAPDAVYSGAFDRQGSAYIDRVFFQRSQHLLNFHVFWADTNSGEGQVTGFSFRWDHDMHGDVLACPFEVSPVSPYQLITRSAFVTRSGSYQMIQEDRHQWIIEEGLASAEHVAFVDLPRRARPSGSDVSSEEALRLLRQEGPVGRVVRHLKAVTNIPSSAVNTVRDVLSVGSRRNSTAAGQAAMAAYNGLPIPPEEAGMPAREIKPAAPAARNRNSRNQADEEAAIDSVAPRTINATTSATLYSDKWGLRQLMITASAKGKLYAQDTGLRSQFVWEKSLVGFGQGQGALAPIVDVKYLGVVREARTNSFYDKKTSAYVVEHLDPLVYVVAEVEQPGTPRATTVWELNPLTGEFVDDAMTGKPLVVGSVEEVRKVKGEEGLAIVDSEQTLQLWPRTEETARAFASTLSQTPFYYTQVASDGRQLKGYALPADFTLSNAVPLENTWSWTLPEGQTVLSTHTSSSLTDAALASTGRDINDWFLTKMPKLLDPAMLIVVSYSQSEGKLLVTLVDQSTGAVLHTYSAPNAGEVDVGTGVHVSFVENWLTVGYNVRNADEVLGGRLISIEYYDFEPSLERSLSNWFSRSLSPRADINSKDSKARAKSVLTRAKQVKAFSRSFIVPASWRGVRSLGVTETLHGAADRALLVASGIDEVHAVPRRLLDARRPYAKGSPQLAGGKQSRVEADSLLPPWDPLLPSDEKRTLTHGIQLPRANPATPQQGLRIHSRRTKLESTTLLAVLGSTDFFLTKLSPGGDFDLLSSTFDKLQLVGTIAVLLAGILVTRPMLKGKTLKARWA